VLAFQHINKDNKMKKLFSFLVITLSSVNLLIVPAHAEEIIDSITGVSYDVDENGNFERLRSTGEADLKIGDRRDITTAKQKATLRAKANIAKFLNERLTSEEVMSNIEKTISTHDGSSSTVNRETIENYMERIQVNADAILKGVIVVKEDINVPEKYVQIEVGYSQKTQQIADSITDNLSKNTSNSNPSIQSDSQPRERQIKKSKNYDSF
jgi:hypothetical protein